MKFELEEPEAARAKVFIDKHRHTGQNFGAIGGHISYVITGTSIGQLLDIECSACKEGECLNADEL